MPSPLAHVAAGYVVYRVAVRAAGDQPWAPSRGRLFVSVAALSLLPDLDSVLGIVMGDFGRYHNNLSHSVFMALVTALSVGAVARYATRGRFMFWFSLVFACYGLHVLMDYFTWSRGVMVLWPMVPDRFSAPVVLFYGFHWSHGWVSPRHLWTFLTEAPVALAAVLTARRVAPVGAGG
jgi:membrane-bound metal-dependent hydrolase YbcI (DUF457 family)